MSDRLNSLEICGKHYIFNLDSRPSKDKCPYCEIDRLTAELAKAQAENERLKTTCRVQLDELIAIADALGTDEGHSSADHITKLITENERLREALEIIATTSPYAAYVDHQEIAMEALNA